MAKLYGEIAANALLTLDKSFSRALGQPLDASEVYYSLAAAETYAATPAAYVGQKIVVVENGVVTHYSIENEAGDLKELGSKPVGDNSSIVVAADGTISLKGVGDLVFTRTLEDGSTEEVRYQPLMTSAGLIWVEPSKTTVEGLAALIDALEADVAAIKGEIGKKVGDDGTPTGLYKEISDAAAAVVGTEGDSADASTVFGAKAYADSLASNYDEAGAADDVKAAVIGASGDAATADTIYGAKAYADQAAANAKAELIGDADDVATDDTIIGAKHYADQYVIAVAAAETATDGYLKTYNISQNNVVVGKIDIPKDFVVTSGAVVVATEEDVAIDSKVEVGKTYIKLTIANQTNPIYIAATDLVDVYTAQAGAAQVQVAISDANVISASIVAGSITETELSTDVTNKLNKAWEEAGTAASLIADLDVAEVTATTAQTFTSIKQEDGKIVVGAPQAISITHDQVSDFEDSVKAVKVTEAGTADAAKALTADAKPIVTNVENQITVTVGGQTSDAVTVAFATDATNAVNATNADDAAKLGGQTKAEIVTEITATSVAANVTGFTTGDQVAKAIGTPGTPAEGEPGEAGYVPAVAGTGVYANVFSKDETTALIADITGGESAADVKAELTVYKTSNNARVDALELEVFGRDAEYDDEGQVVVEAVAGLDERVDALETTTANHANLITELENDINGAEGVVAQVTARVQALEDVGAQANVIEAITVDGVAVTIENKTAAIIIPALEVATAEALGGVKSVDAVVVDGEVTNAAEIENKISVAADGTMSVNSLNVDKLVQTEGTVLILNGGTAAD